MQTIRLPACKLRYKWLSSTPDSTRRKHCLSENERGSEEGRECGVREREGERGTEKVSLKS